MGLIKNYLEKRAEENPRTPWGHLISGNKSNAGVSVTATTAMKVSAVFACVNVLAGTFASVPWITYKRLNRGKERATEHRLYSVLHDRPNPEQTSFVFRSTAKAHVLLYGDAYAEIESDSNGLPVALWPLPAWRVRPLRTQKKELFYQVSLPEGGIKNLAPYQIWHLMGLSTDGTSGLSVIRQAREAIGLAIATEEFGARYFSGGANVGGVAQHPNRLTEQGHKNLQASLDEEYAGLGKSHRLLLLEEGMKYEKVGIPNNDSQFLETKVSQVIEICRMFHVPPHMIGELSRATFTNIEHQGIEFVVYTMNPWYVNCEQETNYKLFGLNSGYFCEFLVDGLLRGDSVARTAYYQSRFSTGSMSPNDIREKENENPVEGGDDCFIPLNMVPLKDAGLSSSSQQENKLTIEIESREKKQGGVHRQRVARSYRAVFEDAAAQVMKKEVDAVRRATKKYLSERSIDQWQVWLNDFYRDFPEHVIKVKMGPAFMALAEAIRFIAASEVNIKEPSIENFVKAYNDNFGTIYTDSSKGQLESIIRDSALNDTDVLGNINTRLDEWEERRPGKVAMNETVRLASAVAKTVFMAAGITKLIWVASGSNSCPICQGLDGQVVGIEGKFDDKTGQVKSSGHPPIHEGCECQIVPGK